jgi:Holliday junction resolvasome RuvABC DNA-binding subunit
MQKSPLFDDSVLALTKLGYKMSDAKSIANKLIGEGVSDLNELIIRAFKR